MAIKNNNTPATTSPTKREQDAAQRALREAQERATMLANRPKSGAFHNPDAREPEKDSDDDFLRILALNQFLENSLMTNLGSYEEDYDANLDLQNLIDEAYSDFNQENADDKEITAEYDHELSSKFSIPLGLAGKHPGSSSRFAVIDDGFKAPKFSLPPSQARADLAKDIVTVSNMYAAEAGMSPKDFAKVLGGVATIESKFGVLRSVSGTKFESSAGGAFHYLNGTIAGEVREGMSDPRIANRVAALGVSVKDGITKSEAWALKEDNVLAGSVLARNIVDLVRKNPELRGDVTALTTRVYQSHNLGDAGAAALARGGRAALEKTDYKADDNNPMFFRGTSSDAEVNQRYSKFVAQAVSAATPLVETAFATSTTTLAATKHQGKDVALGPLTAPEPS